MGVVTPAGVVGRIVKTNSTSSVVLLVTDPNNAIARRGAAGLVTKASLRNQQRARTAEIYSALSRCGPAISGHIRVDGAFPVGWPLEELTRSKSRGDLFQSARSSRKSSLQVG